MRTSFNSPFEVAHLWAHQLQEEAHYGGNFYFDGDTIYSYNRQCPVGRIVHSDDVQAYILNSNYYSQTTARHQQAVESSIPGNAIVFHVSNCVTPISFKGHPCHFFSAMDFIVKKLVKMYDSVEKQHKARTCDYRGGIISCVNEIAKWIDFWKLDKSRNWLQYEWCVTESKRQPNVYQYFQDSKYDEIKKQHKLDDDQTATALCLFSLLVRLHLLETPLYHSEQVDCLLENFYGEDETERIKANIKRAKVRYKRRLNKERKEEYNAKLKELDEWRKGKSDYWYGGSNFQKINGWDTALRVNKDNIQTSKDICLSFDEGKRLWTLIKAFESGKQFQHDLALDLNGHKWKLDCYHNHVLTAGCHNIPFSECQRIADIMHWQ